MGIFGFLAMIGTKIATVAGYLWYGYKCYKLVKGLYGRWCVWWANDRDFIKGEIDNPKSTLDEKLMAYGDKFFNYQTPKVVVDQPVNLE